MREIKFRAWDLRNNKWFHQDLFIMTNAGFYPDFREFDDGQSLWDHEFDLMQYTGLTDKNGVEVYEGDIVAASFWDDEQKIYSETASVEFDEGSFILKIPNDEWSYFNGTQSVEVIGNIHEHSRLLEGEAE